MTWRLPRFVVWSMQDGLFHSCIECTHSDKPNDLVWIGSPVTDPIKAFEIMYKAWNNNDSIFIEAYKQGGMIAVREARGF